MTDLAGDPLIYGGADIYNRKGIWATAPDHANLDLFEFFIERRNGAPTNLVLRSRRNVLHAVRCHDLSTR